MIELYGYWRSSAAYRIRIALNLKGLEYQHQSVHLARDGGEQHSEDYRRLNPAGLVPLLVDGELRIHQSLAILDYLERAYPTTPLLPAEPGDRAMAIAIAGDIACDVHPLDNLRVLKYLKQELEVSDEQKTDWYHHWIVLGFTALEHRLQGSTSAFCVGDQPTWADLCLIPQVYNARRFHVPLESYPKLVAITERCEALEAFDRALPENQPDATHHTSQTSSRTIG